MKVLVVTQGSRGDVQPYMSLAQGVATAGHHVTLHAPIQPEFIGRTDGVRVAPVRDPMRRVMGDPKFRALVMDNSEGVGAFLRRSVTEFRAAEVWVQELLDGLAERADDYYDLIVHSPTIPGHLLAERIGARSVLACLQPVWVPTSSFTNPLFRRDLPRALNRLSYWLTRNSVAPAHLRARVLVSRWRREALRLKPRRGHQNFLRHPDGSPVTVLQGFSPLILPDYDYPGWVHTVGYWFASLSEEWKPDRDLLEFVSAGEPPVYVGFGSMVGMDPDRTGRIIEEALRLTGVRAVIATGWGGIPSERFGRDVFVVDSVPHHWLFPRVAAIVHHGGAGTTGAALASGRPQVVCPFMADQPFHGRRMHAMGVSPAPIPQSELLPELLVSAIQDAIGDQGFSRRAEYLARLIRAENGLEAAIRILEVEAEKGAR